MGHALDNCPTLHLCCMSVTLRIGVMLISVLGLFWTAIFIFCFSGFGKQMLNNLGMPNDVGDVLRYVHGVYGLFLFAVHIVLFLAAAFESVGFCEMYIWFMVFFWLALVISATVVAVASVIADKFLFACLFLLLIFVAILVSFYFTIVVANYRMTLP